MNSTKKLLLVAGARPNFMKVAPIIRALRRYRADMEYRLIHTGQHYDREMSGIFFEDLEIPEPDYYLESGSGSHAEQTAKIMVRFEQVCLAEKPGLVLVVGDVNSTLACSIVAKKLNISVAHVEAGLRSGDLGMPEEINRLVTDAISDYFFVTEQSAIINLRNEGKAEDRIFFVGHVMIDNLLYQLDRLSALPKLSLVSNGLKSKLSAYGLLTLHRPSNVDGEDLLRDLLSTLTELSEKLPLVFPIHPRTQAKISRCKIQIPDTILTISPQSYMDFLSLLKDARMVLTDSGGIQEETTALGIPCLTLRDNTERPVTETEGTNTLVGRNRARILTEAEKILRGEGKVGRCPDLWDGRSAERIVEVLYSKCPASL